MSDIEKITGTPKSGRFERLGHSGHEPAYSHLRGSGAVRQNRGVASRLDGEQVRIEEIDNAEQLHRHIYAWRSLASSCLAGNPGHEAFLVEPVLHHFHRQASNIKFILIWQDKVGVKLSKLIGLFAVQKQGWRWGLPFRLAKSWTHFFTFLGTPLIHKLYAPDAFHGFFTWAENHGRLSCFLFSGMTGEGPYFQALENYLEKTGKSHKLFNRHERAYLSSSLSAEDYLQQSLPRKRRKEYRRLRARLGEQGKLESQFTDAFEGIDVWIDDFLALEAKGWKGKAGTAFLTRDDWSSCIREALTQAFQGGRGLFWKLSLDGKPIAMSFGFKGGRRAWLAKIAYDEEFSQYSPGVLLIFDVIESFTARDDLDGMDSCATPDHPMINRIWRERLVITDMLVDVEGTSKVRFYAACKLEALRGSTRSVLKKIYHIIKNKGWLS